MERFRKIVTESESFAKSLQQRERALTILNNPESQFILLSVIDNKREGCAYLTSDNIELFLDLLLKAIEKTRA